MSARSEQRAAEAQWRESQRGVLQDEHDTATDPERMPPFGWVLAGAAVLLVVVCFFLGWALPIIADRVFS